MTSYQTQYPDTDLACERHSANTTESGVFFKEYQRNGVHITDLQIKTEHAAHQIGRPIGAYLTIGLKDGFIDTKCAVPVFSELLSSLLPKRNDHPLLVIGLGNSAMTADSVGPRVAEMLHASAHMVGNGLAVLSPGITEESGMETAAVVGAITKQLEPRAVIAVDALCTASSARLCSTIQLSNTGICPGSGTGRGRGALNQELLGCPVIAVGIPTIISSHSLAREFHPDTKHPKDTLHAHAQPLYLSPVGIEDALYRGCSLIADTINQLSNLF